MASTPTAAGAAAAIEALLALDPSAVDAGLQVLPLDALVRRPFDPGVGLLLIATDDAGKPSAAGGPGDQTQFEPAVLPGRHGHGADPLDLLRRLYPAAHPVVGLSGAPDTTIESLDPSTLASRAVFLPPLRGIWNASSPHALAWLVARLRGPGGCPWDAEQDHESLRPFLLEEAYEVYDALEGGSTPDLAEELGDLLLQIVLHSQYGAEAGVFDLADVQRGIFTKIVRRHPHVFGDVTVGSVDDVVRNWETIKAEERAADRAADGAAQPTTADGPAGSAANAASAGMPAAFKGLSRSLPALAYASEMQSRAAGLGYDWPDLEGVIDKIAEEAAELLAATDEAQTREEFGDLLFVMVNMGRKLGVDPESALRAASRKFASRFARVERLAGGRSLELRALGLDALDDLWQEAKREEAADQEAAGKDASASAEMAASAGTAA
jgi:tetrapyrrole methylase family protein/MazG family protein